MTKTLTEQWREGTLPLNHYYVKTKSGKYGIDNTVLTFAEEKPITKLAYSDYTEEVLAPVPSYDKVKEMTQKIERLEFDNEVLDMSYSQAKEIIVKLEKQLSIATKALKDFGGTSTSWDEVRCREYLVKQKLKEIKEVK